VHGSLLLYTTLTHTPEPAVAKAEAGKKAKSDDMILF